MEAVKEVVRAAVYNPRFRTLPEGQNSAARVLTFTPEPHEAERARVALRRHFIGRVMVLPLERTGEG